MFRHIHASWVVDRHKLVTLTSISWTQDISKFNDTNQRSKVTGHKTKIPCSCTSTSHRSLHMSENLISQMPEIYFPNSKVKDQKIVFQLSDEELSDKVQGILRTLLFNDVMKYVNNGYLMLFAGFETDISGYCITPYSKSCQKK